MSLRSLAIALSFAYSAAGVGAAPAEYPLIRRLSPQDVVFRQVLDSVAQGYMAEQSSAAFPDLFLCRWVAAGGEDLFSVAARLSLPYETLATLNGIGRPRSFSRGEVVLIPSLAGVFVPELPSNDFETLVSARAKAPDDKRRDISLSRLGKEIRGTFLLGSRLYQTERSFFLDIGFRMPLPEGVVSSRYGLRSSPIDGHDRFHEGVDLAAAAGTDVLAARDGTVVAVGEEPALGLRVVLDHEGGIRTVYGHLSKALVVLNQTVRSGTMIGAVGSTGLSTGPHLHFEIRQSGKARDPSSYLPGLKQ